ncbi:hypothetical protein Tco_0293190, partial [Tanacetum coccineum]
MSLGNSRWGILVRDTIPSEDVGPTRFAVKQFVPRWQTFPQRHVAGESPEMSLGKTPIVVVSGIKSIKFINEM